MKLSSNKVLLFILVITFVFIYQGCDDSGILPPPKRVDSTYFYFKNVCINVKSALYDYSAADLFRGVTVPEVNSWKDVILVDSAFLGYQFYFVSGDAFNDGSGFKTKFQPFIYNNLSQQQFDTITVIPDADSLCESDFNDDCSCSFSDLKGEHPVIAFYLKGKFDTRYTYNRVYGVMYIDSTWRDSTGAFKLRFDGKLNRQGQNHFIR
ncbi:MAG: hypothetical protein EHM58_00030 [Ignavibacteriae bacterium]|nr:MAG: hypothetical protein EHM58_00030 [Ignavibacteriota bacterium]